VGGKVCAFHHPLVGRYIAFFEPMPANNTRLKPHVEGSGGRFGMGVAATRRIIPARVSGHDGRNAREFAALCVFEIAAFGAYAAWLLSAAAH
jgi:hypothetical protein